MSDSVETPVCDTVNLNAEEAMSDVENLMVETVQGATKGPSESLKIAQSTIDKVNLNLSAWMATTKSLLPTQASEETVSEMEVVGAGASGYPSDNTSRGDPVAAIESTARSDTCGTINYATGEVHCCDGDTVIFSMERVADQANTSEKVPELLKSGILALLDESE